MRKAAGSIGNLVHESVPVSATEVSWNFSFIFINITNLFHPYLFYFFDLVF